MVRGGMLIVESRYAKMIDWADLTEEKLTAAVGSSSFFVNLYNCLQSIKFYNLYMDYL